MDGTRLSVPTSGQAGSDPVSEVGPNSNALAFPPPDLPVAQQRFWVVWAPLAIAQRTLTVATIPGLRETCELAALKVVLERKIRKLGPASDASQVLLRNYLKLSQRLNASLREFKLTAFGKAELAAPRKSATASSPWAQVAGR